MAFKSLFTVLTNIDFSGPVIDQAISLAVEHDGHLDVLCLGVDPSQTGYYYAGANAMVLQETIERTLENAEAVETHVIPSLQNAGIRWSTETNVAQLADLGRHVSSRAQFSDLCILCKPYGEGRGAELEPILESVLFEGRSPALVVPQQNAPMSAPKRVLIAWNESPEAMSAIRASLPLLQTAEAVHVVIIDPPTHGPNRSDPGGVLSQFLSRHGVRIEIDVLSKTLPRVSDVLKRHARDMDADMIVMGAYGHSRFREAILGGATRYMLEQADLPVFMAR